MQAARRRGIRLPQPEGAVETHNSSRHESPDILLGSDITGHGSQVDDEERVGRSLPSNELENRNRRRC